MVVDHVKCYLFVCVRHVISALSCADEYSCMLIYVMFMRLKKVQIKKGQKTHMDTKVHTNS